MGLGNSWPSWLKWQEQPEADACGFSNVHLLPIWKCSW